MAGLVVAAYDKRVDLPPANAVGHLVAGVAASSSSSAPTDVPNAIIDEVYDTWAGKPALGALKVALP